MKLEDTRTMKPIRVVICLLLVLFATGKSFAEGNGSDPITVRIVPTRWSEKGERMILLSPATQDFHVVLTNVAKEPVRLWREWCSWGYFTLRFEMTEQNGKKVSITKQPIGWNKNYPDWTVIPPGEHMVFAVKFDASTWQNVPLLEAENPQIIRLKAIFEIPEEVEAKERKIWTGRVASPEDTYTFYR
jgi:hypothetical protein